MSKRAVLTPEVLAGIPALIAQGLCKADIAERLGCKASTLAVRCSTAGISLRGHKKLVMRDKSPINLSRKALAGLTAHAAALGCSPAQLATDLLEAIACDNLYDAVLDKPRCNRGIERPGAGSRNELDRTSRD